MGEGAREENDVRAYVTPSFSGTDASNKNTIGGIPDRINGQPRGSGARSGLLGIFLNF
jgi:hypothetical protein